MEEPAQHLDSGHSVQLRFQKCRCPETPAPLGHFLGPSSANHYFIVSL